ncbi:hypothetical protein JS532_06995 [Bifidobacterium callimiconis]|uniref:hypothetical protein n=1 Tax=Bifidobacterium callimiconis TaxID=2306973 RepID=UPI001BDC8D79|nr:hypothetical protein [Bifidobacterium callimiconis]MBT1177312.1 hypothetical protein [Bifidobacterium callimiconis]
MAEDYNWPIDELRDANGAEGVDHGSTVFSFPSTTASGDTPLLDPSTLAARAGSAAAFDDNPGRKTTIILTSVVAAAIVVTSGGFLFLQHKDSTQSAFDSCQQSVSIYQQSTERLKKTVDSVQSTTQITADAVADPATVDALQKAISDTQNVQQITNDCNASAGTDQNKASDAKITKQTRALGDKNEAVLDASDAVLASKATKDSTDARNALKDQLQQAQQFSSTVASSKADPTARQQLSEALTQSQQLLATDQLMSASVYQNAGAALQAGVDKVNQSALG